MNRGESDPIVDALDAVSRLILGGVPGVIIGGIAASLLGRPRLTNDVDAVVMPAHEDIPDLLARAARVGLVPRIPDAAGMASRHRVLLLRHEPSGIAVDISLGALPFEAEMIERANLVTVAGLKLPLPTPEDLIVLKAVAHRGVDLEDIQAILTANPGLDLRRVRRWVRQFADVLEAPEIIRDLNAIVKKVRRLERQVH